MPPYVVLKPSGPAHLALSWGARSADNSPHPLRPRASVALAQDLPHDDQRRPSSYGVSPRDRYRLPVQLMASVWHNILQLTAQTRDTANRSSQPTNLPLVSAAVRITGAREDLWHLRLPATPPPNARP